MGTERKKGGFGGQLVRPSPCHGCLLITETSCERRNDFLDRALVVETVASSPARQSQETFKTQSKSLRDIERQQQD
jgi:hypothetical protein